MKRQPRGTKSVRHGYCCGLENNMTQVLNSSPPATAATLTAALTEATRRCGFSPEALEALDRTIEDVWRELVDDGMADNDRALRTRLARKLIAFACNGRGDIQAKQLLLRTFRNEMLAAANAGHVAEKPWSAA
jgi:hypothetical protein